MNKCFISDIEYSHNNYRFDVIGVNLEENKIIILETKVSLNDYKKDNKKDNYIECCNELYIITNDYSVKLESEKNRNITGIIYYDTLRNSINVYKNDITNNNVKLNKDEVVILEVNNQEERKYLQGVATEAQLGKKTYSCAYVEPTKSGSGINVKTANITWATPAIVATTLSTAGLTDADVVIAANFPVSGTGALTGIKKAFEDATGKPLLVY